MLRHLGVRNFAVQPQETHTCDATYVDDEALVLLAKSPDLLDSAINVLLGSLVSVFSSFSLAINWDPGKTEMMLKYRGKGAARALEKRRRPDGTIAVALPLEATAQFVKVVDKYKHVGSITAVNNNDFYEVQHRCTETLKVYAPISQRILGHPKLAHG